MPDTRIFVISDLHAEDSRFAIRPRARAHQTPSGKASWLDYSSRVPGDQDPIQTLLDFVSTKNIRADYLVVAGDICDKANGDALRFAWSELQQLRLALGADALLATAGNHDLDSRFRRHPYDPRAVLLDLLPVFPVGDRLARAEFWGYGVSDVRFAGVRFVVVNSCAFHGGAEEEIDHGRISEYALKRLREIVTNEPVAPTNVLLCHHHPYPIPGNLYGEDDRMINGESLLDILDRSQLPWLVIHEHRHSARLLYAGGSGNSPVVLAAGSASVVLSPELLETTRNQAHLITVRDASTGGSLRGVVDTWNYVPRVGWESPAADGGLPPRSGFGLRGDLSGLVSEISAAVRSNDGPLAWDQLVTNVPDLQYVTPLDFERLKRGIRNAGFQFVPNDIPVEVAPL